MLLGSLCAPGTAEPNFPTLQAAQPAGVMATSPLAAGGADDARYTPQDPCLGGVKRASAYILLCLARRAAQHELSGPQILTISLLSFIDDRTIAVINHVGEDGRDGSGTTRFPSFPMI